MEQISWDDFSKIELRAGTIIGAEPFPEARKPAYKLRIDFGDLGTRTSSAQITDLYQPSDLIGKQVLCVLNFPPKQIANFHSECLVTGVANADGHVVLVSPDTKVENGVKLF